MADFLNLALVDHTDTGSKYNLLTGALALKRGSWQPVSGQGDELIIETMDVIAAGTVTAITAAEAEINDLLERAALFHNDSLVQDSVWLEWSTDSEPGAGTYAAKRALLYGGALQVDQPDISVGGFLQGSLFAKLILIRHPLWEELIEEEVNDSSVSLWCGEVSLSAYGYSGGYSGTAPSRIEVLQFAIGNAIYKMWVGIRDLYQGVTDFDPKWELEDGTNGTDTTTQTVSGASGGDVKQCTFSGDSSMVERVSIAISDVLASGSEEHFIGRYLVLLRCQLSSAGSCLIKMYHGLSNQVGFVPSEAVFMDNTGWELIELGHIQIPPDGYRDQLSNRTALEDFTISIHAEQLSGSGNLNLDALCLIPSDHIVSVDQIGANPFGLYIETFEDDTAIARVISSSVPVDIPELAISAWHLPRDPGIMVIAGQRETSHVLTDDITSLNLQWYPRHRLYRDRT